jgi:hypothetical protein
LSAQRAQRKLFFWSDSLRGRIRPTIRPVLDLWFYQDPLGLIK